MRILHIETGRHLYGGALQVVYLLQGLQNSPYQNLLLCPAGSRIAEVAAPFAAVKSVPMHGDLDPLFPLRLGRMIKVERPDLIHVHSRRGADVWGAVMARISGMPAVITRRVDNPETGWLARLKYRQYARVVVISEGIRRVLVAGGIPADGISIIPSAVDFRQYNRRCRRNWVNEQLGVTSGDRLVGMVAQFIPRKGHQLLLEAIPAVVSRVPSVIFLLFGKGPLEPRIRDEIRRRGLQKQVIMGGFREDLADILPCLDVLVHPASMEGLGVSLLQAGAAGIPCVATRAGGIPEIVRHEHSGYLADQGDAKALAGYVIELLENANKAIRFGLAAQRMIQERFSIEAMVTDYQALYDDLVSP